MSYFDSLSQFQQSQEQIAEHTKGVEQEQLSATANDLQSKYDYAEEQLNRVAGFTTSIGAGIHGARRSYLKVKKGFQNLQEKATDLKNKVSGNPDAEGTGRDTEGAGDSHNHVANGQEGDKPIDAANSTKEANQEDLEDRVGNTADKEGANNQVKGERDPNEPDPASAEKPSLNPEEGAEAPPEAPVQQNKASLDEPNEVAGEDAVERQVPEEGAAPPTEGVESNLSNGAKEISANAQENLSNVAKGNVEQLGGDAEGNATDSLVKGAGNIAEKVMPDLTEGVSSGVSTALETAGAVADFLGPVGEIVGAGIGLGSFFHDLFAKKKLDAQEDAVESTPTATAGKGGIDTSNLSQGAVKSNVVGTLY